MTDQSSQDVQREADRSRARVSSTLDELKERLTPGQILDDLMSSSGSGGSAFMSNLGSSLRDHPFPALLIGAGVLMYMSSGEKKHVSQTGSGSGSVLGSAAGAIGDSLQAGAEAVKDAMSSAADRASDIGDKIGDVAASASSHARDLRDSAPAMGLPKILEDQPLVLGALGFALGAVLGAALPMSDAENELMGAKSDAVKDAAIGAAKSTVHQVGDMAAKVAQEAEAEAQKQGLTGQAGSLVDKIGAVGEKAASALEREVQSSTGAPRPGTPGRPG